VTATFTDHRLSVGVGVVVEQQVGDVEKVLLGGRVKSREPVLHTSTSASTIG